MTKSTQLRATAVPLITVDPFFSIWSCADSLHGDCTRHWSGKPNPIIAGIFINGNFWSIAGVTSDYRQLQRKMHQKYVKITPLSSEYIFENDFVKIMLKFTTPLILNDFDIMGRPVSYIEYEIEKKFNKDLEIEFVFGISARCVVNEKRHKVIFKKTDYSFCVGNTIQNPLSQSGDKIGIDWGYLHLCDKNSFVACWDEEDRMKTISSNAEYYAYSDMPYMMVKKQELSGIITVAYDEIYPIEYFGKKLKESYTKNFDTFEEMVIDSISRSREILQKCRNFEKKIMDDSKCLGENYQSVISIAYRQAIAAHKMVYDERGELLFLSKECASNGCIGTLDVTYPSIPLFLKYNPELVLGMLRPILKYAKSSEWTYEFAPHDVGQYPLANGQVYGMQQNEGKQLKMQMPVEECGNMLLCLAAVKKYSKDGKFQIFDKNENLLKAWADYLVKYGYDPGNQLCTDDFAGHLEHNCNLSLKAILAIASYSYLSGEDKYMKIAEEYASKWEKEAKAEHNGTRLTFDNSEGWSIKYNIVWDKLLGFDLFSDELKKKEIELYKTKVNRYGVPLDSREKYTKIDWLMWSTMIYNDEEYFEMITKSIVDMMNETQGRVPLTDWYCTVTAEPIYFQARSVVGGLFINLL